MESDKTSSGDGMRSELLSASGWKDYELLDSGRFEKLERFGRYVLARPEPQAVWDRSLSEDEWRARADAVFRRDGRSGERGEWTLRAGMPDRWFVEYGGGMSLKFRMGLTSFKHVGLFPEQAENWEFIFREVRRLGAGARVLNLFAYTGGASLAARAAGADVTHVDSVKPVVSWARENMEASGMDGIRWIVEDALNRIDGLLEKKPLPQSVNPAKPQDASISFKNVSYRYDGASDDAIHNISLDIKSGEHIAFVGPSGGGKSTLAKLIARFADVNSGFIEIGGVNVKNIKASDLMNTVSFVFQDSKLLKMSIFDNVRMGNKNATREEVIEALHNAQCDDIIEKIPGGIDTVIGSKGTYLSGGETQRIAIARAMLKNAPILILDEATAFADPDNEAKVQAAFSKLSEGKTVIMIAHRLSSVTEVDRIYVLKNGQICQSGTHENLLSQDGLYAHMWKEFNKSVSWKVGA